MTQPGWKERPDAVGLWLNALYWKKDGKLHSSTLRSIPTEWALGTVRDTIQCNKDVPPLLPIALDSYWYGPIPTPGAQE